MPLSILLIPLFIFLVAFVIFAFSAFYHIIRFELLSVASMAMTAIFIGGTFVIGTVSLTYMNQIDWNEEMSFSVLSDFQENVGPQNNVISF